MGQLLPLRKLPLTIFQKFSHWPPSLGFLPSSGPLPFSCHCFLGSSPKQMTCMLILILESASEGTQPKTWVY